MPRRIAFAPQLNRINDSPIPRRRHNEVLASSEEQKSKEGRNRYSKLAFFVTKVASKEETNETSLPSCNSSLSSGGLDYPISQSQDLVFDFEDCEAALLKKKKKMFELKRPSRNCAFTTTCKSRQNVAQRKYSRIAFSVQNVGSDKKRQK